MAEQKESSVLFSLKELMSLEENRIKEEEADKEAVACAEAEAKAAAERAARSADALASASARAMASLSASSSLIRFSSRLINSLSEKRTELSFCSAIFRVSSIRRAEFAVHFTQRAYQSDWIFVKHSHVRFGLRNLVQSF